MKKMYTIIVLITTVMVSSISCQKATLTDQNSSTVLAPASATQGSNPDLLKTVGTNVQEFNELKDAEQEGRRMRINYWRWTDFDPTGFYIPANSTLTINVQQLAGTALPKLIIGTYYRYMTAQQGDQAHIDPPVFQLTAGVNTISSGQYGYFHPFNNGISGFLTRNEYSQHS